MNALQRAVLGAGWLWVGLAGGASVGAADPGLTKTSHEAPSQSSGSASQPGDLRSLEVLTAGYPRAYFFRSSEGVAARPGTKFDAWDTEFSRLMGIEGKTLEEEVPGRSLKNIDYFTRFKSKHPEQLVMLHYNGNARDPRDQGDKFFAGHWIYFNGTTVTQDIPAEGGEATIAVEGPSLFRTKIGRNGDDNEDIGLCVLNDLGKPDWRQAEQLQLVSIDLKGKSLRVKRGCYGTKPLAFKGRRAYVAAHAGEGPWGKNSHLLWSYNYATTAPRDAAGRSCVDVLVDDLGDRFVGGGALRSFDGLQFDVLSDKPHAAAGRGRGVDVDADGQIDGGLRQGVNVYQPGVIDFLTRLHAKIGKDRLLLADGWNTNHQRAFGVLNGIESEGWPSLNDYKVQDWSGGLNRQAFWVANSAAPAFSYINHKFNSGKGDEKARILGYQDIGWNISRLVFAGAVFTDSAICFSMEPPGGGNDRKGGIWDELQCGSERRLGYLGKPLGAAVHLAASGKKSFAIGPQTAKQVVAQNGAKAAVDGTTIRLSGLGAGGQGNSSIKLQINDVPVTSDDLFLTFEIAADPLSQSPPMVARIVQGGIAGKADRFLGWANQKPFGMTLYYPNAKDLAAKNDTVSLTLEIEGSTPVSIANLAAWSAPDAMYRLFEHGLVVANPSLHEQTFDLGAIAPGRTLRRIKGSADQDPKTNSGQAVSGVVHVGPKDALFLVEP